MPAQDGNNEKGRNVFFFLPNFYMVVDDLQDLQDLQDLVVDHELWSDFLGCTILRSGCTLRGVDKFEGKFCALIWHFFRSSILSCPKFSKFLNFRHSDLYQPGCGWITPDIRFSRPDMRGVENRASERVFCRIVTKTDTIVVRTR